MNTTSTARSATARDASPSFAVLARRTAQLGFRALNIVAIPLIELGLGNPLHVGAGPVVVETTGRRSGLTRKVPLLSGRIGSTVAVATVRPDSLWMANLATLPQANVRLFGNNHPATASFTSVGPLRVALLHVTAAG